MKSSNGSAHTAQSLGQLSLAQLKALRQQSAARSPHGKIELGPQNRGDRLPLSFAQERLWFLDQLGLVGSAYNMPLTLRLEGALDVDALQRSFAELVRRHESLRTRFEAIDGQPRQVIDPPGDFRLDVHDLSNLGGAAEMQKEVDRRCALELARPFDLARGPLMSVALLALSPREHVLLLTMHHIVSDGWSIGVLTRELGALYEAYSQGKPSPLPELPVQYADYAIWQRQWLRDDVLEGQLQYWRERLAGAPQLELPTDRPRPEVATFKGGAVVFELPARLADALEDLAKSEGVTAFMVLLAAYQIVLARHSGQQDILVGTPVAARTHAQIEGLIGFFVNTLVLRNDLSGNPSFRQLLARVKETTLGAWARQDLPFDKLVAELRPERNLTRQPIFQVAMVLQNMPLEPLELAGITWTPIEIDWNTSIFDLKLELFRAPRGFEAAFEYATDLFDRSTVERMASHFRVLLESAVADPDASIWQLPMLGKEERSQVLTHFSGIQGAGAVSEEEGARCFHELFEQRARKHPDGTALIFGQERMSYGRLNEEANQLARHLVECGVGPEVLVALSVRRSFQMVVALLAILKAGGAYVPLDSTYPRARLAYMLEHSAAPIIVTERELVDALPIGDRRCVCLDDANVQSHVASQSRENLPRELIGVGERNLAYVIYTSGSTGKPKGVMIEHRGWVNFGRAMSGLFGVTEKSRGLQFSSMSFDALVFELSMMIPQGGSLCLVTEEEQKTAERLDEIVERNGLTHALLPPVLLGQLRPEKWRSLTTLVSGGEAITEQAAREWRKGRRLFNAYGPTEVTVCATVGEIGEGPVSIGTPLRNAVVRVLDGAGRLAPIGVAGELCVGGVQVARGYWKDEEKTAERFVEDPYGEPGERLYRTGDLARWLANGELEFLGRIDEQVKLRGYRIELGEIEAALASHEALRTAVVSVSAGEGDGSDKRLVAYVCPTQAYLDAQARAFNTDSLGRWTAIYEDQYANTSEHVEVDRNFGGWMSSYTREPIATSEMDEWLEGTLERIRALKPRRMLEIGCGSGLLLYRYAESCESVVATDISASALRTIETELGRRAWSHVTLRQGHALEMESLPEGEFDSVVVNSVIQYFPNLAYLEEMIERVLARVAPGGTVLIGDVRNADLLEAHATAVEHARQNGQSETAGALSRRVQRRMQQEKELLVSPTYFVRLGERMESIDRVDVMVKRGVGENEMLRYRYEVALHKKGPAPRETAGEVSWSDFETLETLRARLQDGTANVFGISGIPNGRVEDDVRLAEGLRQWPAAQAVVSPRRAGGFEGRARAHVQALEGLLQEAEKAGYACGVTWSQQRAEQVDAIFSKGTLPPIQARGGYRPMGPMELANHPQMSAIGESLTQELQDHLRERLPEYMVPGIYIAMARLPLTANQKVDKRALPVPEEGDLRRQEYVAPRDEVETQLCELWQELLKVGRVGIHDNFFSLGGHSLLATRLVSAVRQTLQVEVPLRSLFQSPTVEQLSHVITAHRIESVRRDRHAGEKAGHMTLEGEV